MSVYAVFWASAVETIAWITALVALSCEPLTKKYVMVELTSDKNTSEDTLSRKNPTATVIAKMMAMTARTID